MNGSIYLLTGERGAGKTVICRQVSQWAQQEGHSVAGLLTERESNAEGATDPAVPDRRSVVDLSTGERFDFGHRGKPAMPSTTPLPGWRLDPTVFRRGNEAFADATPCDLLVVDELGPSEILSGDGWTSGLATLISRDYKAALVVCRPTLLNDLIALIGPPAPAVVAVDADSRDQARTAVMGALRRALRA